MNIHIQKVMIRMPNSQMLQSNSEEMDESGQFNTMPSTNVDSLNMSLTPDMVFNDGHKLSIIVYRYAREKVL